MNTKVLLVDDNQDLLTITQIILKAQGYTTFLAGSVAEAARKIRIHQPALLLLDVNICDADDGRQYCRQLKQAAATKGIRVILMSGRDLRPDEWGDADDFLQKPFDFDSLVEKVSRQLLPLPQLAA